MKRTIMIITALLTVGFVVAAEKYAKVNVTNTYNKERKAVPVVVNLMVLQPQHSLLSTIKRCFVSSMTSMMMACMTNSPL